MSEKRMIHFKNEENGDAQCVLCRYIDENHTEIDGVLYDTKDFIRRMKHNKISYAPA